MPLQFESNFSSAFQVTNSGPIVITEKPDTSGWVPSQGPHSPTPTNRIIQSDQPFQVDFDYTVQGFLASLLPPTCKWTATLYLEQYGGGEASPGSYSVSVPHVSAVSNTYNISVQVPDNALQPGLYEMALSVTFEATGGIPLPPAGFANLGKLQVFESV